MLGDVDEDRVGHLPRSPCTTSVGQLPLWYSGNVGSLALVRKSSATAEIVTGEDLPFILSMVRSILGPGHPPTPKRTLSHTDLFLSGA